MKTIKQLCYLCLAAIMSAAAWACSTDEISGSIAGSVSDRTTGDPVSAVSVTIKPGGASTVTGSDGAFTFTFDRLGHCNRRSRSNFYRR